MYNELYSIYFLMKLSKKGRMFNLCLKAKFAFLKITIDLIT